MTLGTDFATTHRIVALGGAQLDRGLDRLVRLFTDAVESGAVDGVAPPLDAAAVDYWLRVRAAVARATRILLVDAEIRGAVQIGLDAVPSARHRAVVRSLFVHRDARGQGLGGALIDAAEKAARRAGRTLVVVETRPEPATELFYARLGYVRQGTSDASVSFYRELT